MKKNYLGILAGAALLFFGAGIAYGQNATLRIDDSGKVIATDFHHHAKVGHKITWARQSGGAKPWFVRFADSPCAEGSEFGSDRGKTCTVQVTCSAGNGSGCKPYKYSSATGPNAPMNDPDIIVDP